MAYDSARGRLVLVGGNDGISGYVADTWELGTTWELRAPTTPITARRSHAATYDSARRKVVLFGGFNGASLDETWEYDGTTWAQLTLDPKPSARSGHALAYDSTRQRVVMFGGGTTAPNDTWEFDGTEWEPIATTNSPPGRAETAMAYDAARGRIVLFGGRVGFSTMLDDTWEYDGATWEKRTLQVSPAGRSNHTMVYDESRQRVILFGGDPSSEIWELGPTSWEQRPLVASSVFPQARSGNVFAYDAIRQQLVMFGGLLSGGSVRSNETWTLGFGKLVAGEACSAAIDYDGDGAIGCLDDDCWGTCSPLCAPTVIASNCPTTPRCGDAICSTIEDCRSCPADCAVGGSACPIQCGDHHCDSETMALCPGDCTP
jgi:hypothetical protein